MSYARWSNSCWYAFYNVNGCLSLWYSMDSTIDLTEEEVRDIVSRDAPKRITAIMDMYACDATEAEEAIRYMEQYLEDVNES